ncbi:flagellar basal body P-ring formation chaperone FlgA [Brenneria tiliae]|uniref:flagellar basal body P-ring formation chaperone FlgA n=1 Tax=Brenneria tiliae TaxID=2914984 RepID=UPI002014DFF6|nr:flagellar basal body P-ring formation chaperone FlgA [Brenneria tiliae]MCL2899815.1 flagellar basal body P-ring formation protein FlgA [Brenneria tiliae]MCL2904696.1 flagellar basal body P-ring formation protein FlgA [Brenneria tiliae]
MRCVARYYTAILCLTTLNATASAIDLSEQVTAFVRQQIDIPSATVNVKLKSAKDNTIDCSNPQFSLPFRKKPGGTVNIKMVCGTARYYLATEIQISGRYLVAARSIPINHKITDVDIKWRKGRIDKLTIAPIMQTDQVVGSISQRAIGAGQTISDRMLRHPWAVSAGQTVSVTITGEGFSITNQGKVMNNAAINGKTRIRMDSGQIIEGVVSGAGTVIVGQ